MFWSLANLIELVQSLAKIIFVLKRSVKLRHRILCGDEAACHGMACVLFDMQTESAQQTAHTPFHDILPHHHTIYNDKIIPNVLTEL
jgi:hypothetical protein